MYGSVKRVVAVNQNAVLALLLAVLLAGCTAPGTQPATNQSETQQFSETRGTVHITEIYTSNNRLRPGDKIRMVVTVQNRNNRDARGQLQITNVAPLEVTGTYYQTAGQESNGGLLDALFRVFGAESAPSGEEGKYPNRQTCNLGELRAGSTQSLEGERTVCGWELTCPEDSECSQISTDFKEPFPVPVTFNLVYNTTLASNTEDISIEFLPFEQMDSSMIRDKTFTMENGDLSFSTTYETPIEVSSNAFTLTHEVREQDFATGTLNSPIYLRYSGSLVGDALSFADPDALRDCDTIVLDEQQTSAEVDCSIGLLSEPRADTIYQLLIEGSYEFRKTQRHQVQVQPTN